MRPGHARVHTLEALEVRLFASATVFPLDADVFVETPRVTTWVRSVADRSREGIGRVLTSLAAPPGPPAPATAWANLIHLADLRQDPRFVDIDGVGYTSVVIDTGVDLSNSFFGPDNDHDGIADRILYQYDFADNDHDATDRNGHGTNVASILGSQSLSYPGVAPGAGLIVLKVFTDAGTGNFTMVERALQWVVDHVDRYNIVSVNLSLGDNRNYASPQRLYGISDEIERLASLSVKVVASAGNLFYRFNSATGVGYPAADANAIAVGAVFPAKIGAFTFSNGAEAYDSNPDVIAPFSQRRAGTTSLFAPGVQMYGAAIGGGISVYAGTSQAAPVVAGLAVLADQMADRFLGRRLTVPEFRVLLEETGQRILDGDDELDNVVNTGQTYTRVDALAMAVRIMAMGNPPTNSPPSLTSVATLTRARPGGAYVVTYDRLAAAAVASDPDGDPLQFRVERVLEGTLLKDGEVVTPGVTLLRSGESLVWIPATSRAGITAAFTIVASDSHAVSTPAVAVTIDAGPRAVGYTTRAERLTRFTPAPARTNETSPVLSLPGWMVGSRAADLRRDPPQVGFVAWVRLRGSDLRVGRYS